MAYDIAACVGLPQRCYVFPRYENVCAAYDLCALLPFTWQTVCEQHKR